MVQHSRRWSPVIIHRLDTALFMNHVVVLVSVQTQVATIGIRNLCCKPLLVWWLWYTCCSCCFATFVASWLSLACSSGNAGLVDSIAVSALLLFSRWIDLPCCRAVVADLLFFLSVIVTPIFVLGVMLSFLLLLLQISWPWQYGHKEVGMFLLMLLFACYWCRSSHQIVARNDG